MGLRMGRMWSLELWLKYRRDVGTGDLAALEPLNIQISMEMEAEGSLVIPPYKFISASPEQGRLSMTL